MEKDPLVPTSRPLLHLLCKPGKLTLITMKPTSSCLAPEQPGRLTLWLLAVSLALSCTAPAQESQGFGLSLSANCHRFATSTWFQNSFTKDYAAVPTLGVDLPLSAAFALNARVSYITTTGNAVWWTGGRPARTELEAWRLDLLLARHFALADGMSLSPELGPFVAFISERREAREFYIPYFDPYTTVATWSFGLLGVTGGVNLLWSIPSTPLGLLLNLDGRYGYRGEQSLLREYGSLDVGLGLRFRLF